MTLEQQIRSQEERYQQRIKAHEEWCQLRVQAAEHDRDYALGLASAAHLELMQAIKYGFNPATAHSTLISIGKLSPRLNEMREKYEQTYPRVG